MAVCTGLVVQFPWCMKQRVIYAVFASHVMDYAIVEAGGVDLEEKYNHVAISGDSWPPTPVHSCATGALRAQFFNGGWG